MEDKNAGLITKNSIFGLIALGAVLVLMVPLVAMQFTDEVDWKLNDFVIAGLVLFSFASVYVLIARRIQERNRLIVGSILLFLFVWLWAELAVGVFTNWGS